MDRRLFIGSALAAAGGALAPRALGKTAAVPSDGFRQLDLELDGHHRLARRVLVLIPEHLDPSRKHPLLVLLHGYGPAAAAARTLDAKERRLIHAWRKDYAVVRAYNRLRAPPIRPIYRTVRYLKKARAEEINAGLAKSPFEGMVLACPMVPVPYFRQQAGPVFERYARWIEETLLPAVRDRAPVRTDAASTGLAGHSMGGHVGIEVFLRKPELFGSFSGVQVAIEPRAAKVYAGRFKRMLDRVGPRAIQVQTSTRDKYRNANRLLHERLVAQQVSAELRQSFGAHTGSWMREIGSLETLLWQDRVLRGRAL